MKEVRVILSPKAEEVYRNLNQEAESFVWALPKDALKLQLESFTRKTIQEHLL